MWYARCRSSPRTEGHRTLWTVDPCNPSPAIALLWGGRFECKMSDIASEDGLKSHTIAPSEFKSATQAIMLHKEVVNGLRNLLLEGNIPPGARIPERELCDRFQVSRTPLREALKVLAAEGLV